MVTQGEKPSTSEHYLQMLFLTLHHNYGSHMTRAQVENKRKD